ncbi:MAG: hypothetical protein QM762_13400 [Chryseolinea sp.]
MVLLSKDFLKLIIVATLIAVPLAWWGLEQWLHGFVYRVPVGWREFVLTAIIAVVIAFLTISAQVIKAALVNPVKSLRSE